MRSNRGFSDKRIFCGYTKKIFTSQYKDEKEPR